MKRFIENAKVKSIDDKLTECGMLGDHYKQTESFTKGFKENAKVQFNEHKLIECGMLSDNYKLIE